MVFEVRFTTDADAPAKERVLYSFGSFEIGDGILPNAALLPAGQGFFGVTCDGGANVKNRQEMHSLSQDPVSGLIAGRDINTINIGVSS